MPFVEPSLSKIAVIGDVHAQDRRLAKVLQFLNSNGLQAIICVGDLVDGDGDAERCCQLLMSREIPTLLGNHDQWLLAGENRGVEHATERSTMSESSLQFLAQLPKVIRLRNCSEITPRFYGDRV